MRKSRFVVRDIEVKLSDNFGLNFSEVADALSKVDITLPSWAAMMFIFVRSNHKSLDVSFFEDSKDFFIWYSKVMIRKPEDLRSASYSKEGNDWKVFLPPTLIGVHLRTQLRH